ncbi:hypothetical protein ABBQ38_006902 [Trebouxia sp. C0009 RCD-2024]
MSTLHRCLDKNALLDDHKCKVAKLKEEQRAAAAGQVYFQDITSHADPAACTLPYGMLKPVNLDQLQLEHRHKGCRIQGTVCCEPIRSTAIQLLLMDAVDDSKAVKVRVYNLLPSNAPMAEVRALLPEGTRLAIKEPYYKTYDGDGSSGIRVDNPADVVFLQARSDQELVTDKKKAMTFDEIKAAGNAAFRSSNYTLAQALYERCRLQQPQNVQVLSNLAAVHLCLKKWLEALKHAQVGLEIDPKHIKCLYHCADAAMHLGQYTKAIHHLTLAETLAPSSPQISTCLRTAQELQRQSLGQYDPGKLFLNQQDKAVSQLANFTGPLKVTHLPGKGRGMVVTKDVKAGTLLAVCNPLAIAYTDPLDMGYQFDPLTGRKNDRSQTNLITKLANVSMHNPDVLQQMYALYDGTQQSLENTPEITLFNNQLPG